MQLKCYELYLWMC